MQRIASLFGAFTLTVAFGATALAQAPPPSAAPAPAPITRVRGTITSFAGGVLTVQGVGQVYKLTVPDNARYAWIVKSDFSKIAPNAYIATVAVPQPDGTMRATAVQIFPEAQRGVGEGIRPWDTVPNGLMTNATVTTVGTETVDKVDGRTMVVKYKDTEKKIFVPANVPIITLTPADPTALTPGAHLQVNATKAADGSLIATSIQVGKDGLIPPM
jgi:hypothetical protein